MDILFAMRIIYSRFEAYGTVPIMSSRPARSAKASLPVSLVSKRVPPDAPADRQFVTALARGLEILRCFSRQQPELRVVEIARMIGVPQPTVWRLCHTLLALGYLTHARGGDRLQLGVPVLGLGMTALANQPFGEVARPYMQALADRFHGGVGLGARNDLEIIYLQRCQGPSIILTDLGIGSRLSIIRSATGWAHIAGTPRPARDELLARIADDDPAGWQAMRQQVEQAVRHYETHGFIVCMGAIHPQINAAAVLFRAPIEPHGFLAISCGGIASVFTADLLSEIGGELVRLANLLEAR
jgi:DNA-binding IclR family transcriptional regulator